MHDEVLNILIAGRNTTTTMLTFAVYLLAVYPVVLERLRAEVLEKVGPKQRPTYENIKEMRYLRAVINETLSQCMSAFRSTKVSCQMRMKSHVLQKTECVTVVNEAWLSSSQEYDPDCFLDERVNKYIAPNPFIFLPFSAGPRICLGQQFAYNAMSSFLIKLLQPLFVMELALEVASPADLPPAEWAKVPGRKGKERSIPKSHLTLQG